MKYFIVFLLFFSMSFGRLYGQEDRILDSLKRKLRIATDNKNMAGISEQIGMYHGNYGNLDSSILYFNMAIHYSENSSTSMMAMKYKNLAVAYGRQGKHLDSCDLYIRKAYNYFKSSKDTANLIEVLDVMISLQHAKQNSNKAISYIKEALNLINSYEKNMQMLRAELSLWYQLGQIYSLQKNYDKSLSIYKQAIEGFDFKNHSREINREVAVIYTGIALDFIATQQLDSALLYCQKSIALSERYNFNVILSYAYSYIGEIYKEKKDYKKALFFLKNAENENKIVKGTSYLYYSHIIDILVEQNKMKEAIKYQELYDTFLNEIDVTDQKVAFFNTKQNLFYKLGRYDSAYHYLSHYINYKDSLYSMSNAEKTSEIQAKYETAKKEKKIAERDKQLAEERLKKQITQEKLSSEQAKTSAISSVAALLFFVGGLIFLFYKKVQKQRDEINTLKDALEHDVENDTVIIRRASDFSLDKLNTLAGKEEFEQLQLSLLAVASYYDFKTTDIEVDEFLEKTANLILIKYGKQNEIRIAPSYSNLDNKSKADQSVVKKLRACLVEMVRNSAKYAFPPKVMIKDFTPTLKIDVEREGKDLFVRYTDNGVGFPTHVTESEILPSNKGLGLLKRSSYPSGFICKNKSDGGVFIQVQLKVDMIKTEEYYSKIS